MLGVNVTEWDRKVIVADCLCRFVQEELKVLQLLDSYCGDVGHLRHLYCRYEARAYRYV